MDKGMSSNAPLLIPQDFQRVVYILHLGMGSQLACP